MKKIFSLCCQILILFTCKLNAQNIGIGTTTPNSASLLHIDLGSSATKGFLISGNNLVNSTVPDLGAGSRLMFYPGKNAFREGYVSGTHWDNSNVGVGSVAMGSNTIASGTYSISMGTNTTASGTYSTSMGSTTLASGNASTAMGAVTIASGDNSTAMGNYVSTSGFKGSFAIGDNSTGTVMQSFVADGFRARFAGGYRLFTNSAVTVGAFLNANANSWAALSDVRMKENFLQVNGESFLNKIAGMHLTTWNYKGQNVKTLRHYGPMGQDFFKAFGKDELGTIGCDTLINQQDFLGVNLIAIQALEKRTTSLKKENKKLKTENENMQNKIAGLESRLKKLEKLLSGRRPHLAFLN
jgi:Head domain of trimeric autotransporter adhesin/Chaperone of endosialidase